MVEVNTVSGSAVVVAADDCLSTTIDGEAVILDPNAGQYYGFNEVGSFIWEHIQDPETIDAVCEAVGQAYDVSEDRCRSDVEDLFEEMLHAGLVEVVD